MIRIVVLDKDKLHLAIIAQFHELLFDSMKFGISHNSQIRISSLIVTFFKDISKSEWLVDLSIELYILIYIVES